MNSHHSFHIRFLHLPILTYERKFISPPRSMQFAWHPTEILLRLVVGGRLTDSLARVLSHLSPSARNFFRCHRSIHQFHISLLAGYSIFKVHGNLTFHIYPDIRKAKYSNKSKISKKLLICPLIPLLATLYLYDIKLS